VEGAVISSSRILIAALLGPLLVADPPLTVQAGSAPLFSSWPMFSWPSARPADDSPETIRQTTSVFQKKSHRCFFLFNLDMAWRFPDNPHTIMSRGDAPFIRLIYSFNSGSNIYEKHQTRD
jgi:hypothetical protein